jgi:hypothetical protein
MVQQNNRQGRIARKASPERLSSPPATGRVTLQEVLESLGGIVRVLVAPKGLDVPVDAPVILDLGESTSFGRDCLILAVGIRPESREARQVVAAAAASGAAAVVVRGADPDSPMAAATLDAGIALLSVPRDVPWGHAFTLINAVVTNARPSTDDAGESGVPLGDLFALANAVAASVGGAVAIEDPRGKVLAYSTLEGQPIDDIRRQGIFRRQIPDLPGVREVYRRLWRSEGVIRVDELDGLRILPRLAAPVRAGSEILGSLWVVEGAAPFGVADERNLLEAARLAALHLLRARAAEDLERRMRADLLRSVLGGTGSVPLAASRLELTADSECAVMAFELPTDDEAERELHRGQLVDVILFYCETFNRQAACVLMDNAVYALLPVAGPAQGERLRPLARSIIETAEGRLRVAPRVGIGSVVTLADAPESRREADRALQVLSSDPTLGPVVAIGDVRPQAILLELREVAESTSLFRGPLTALVAEDRKRGGLLLPTLRAYVDAFGDVPLAASRLRVHPNTFRYRLRKALAAVDFSDPDRRLVVQLQLRLQDFSSDPRSDGSSHPGPPS